MDFVVVAVEVKPSLFGRYFTTFHPLLLRYLAMRKNNDLVSSLPFSLLDGEDDEDKEGGDFGMHGLPSTVEDGGGDDDVDDEDDEVDGDVEAILPSSGLALT